MKRKTALLLAAVLLASMLAACGAAPTQSTSVPSSENSIPPASPVSLPPVPSVPESGNPQEPPESTPAQPENALPEGFVYLTDITGDVLLEMRYYSSYNFVGARIDGYEAPVAILCEEAAQALAAAAAQLKEAGYILKIFDAYRPMQAVAHFLRWSEDDADQRMKDAFYPDIEKARLFPLGYLAERSGHSRGSTVDLTLVEAATGRELDMGTPFDFFGAASGHGTAEITAQQAANRQILKTAMEANGFIAFSGEWWHYLLADEPWPDTYFDFPVR